MISEINNIYFSIIICCYNSEKFISETLNSVITQNYDKWELIIIDDGSEDNTEKILKKIINKNPNKNIQYFKQENKGLAQSRNFAIKLCKYPWIALLDHDDISLPHRLKYQAQQIINNSNCDLFFSDMIYFNNSLEFSRFNHIYKTDKFMINNLDFKKINAYNNLIKHGCFIGSSTVVFSKSSFNRTDGFNTSFKFLTDYVFFLDISKKFNLFCSKDALVKWRMHPNQSTKISNRLYLKEMNLLYFSSYTNRQTYLSTKFKIIIRHMKIIVKLLLNY
jgi:glycosyltransferase involved in cell wall biosynthesis